MLGNQGRNLTAGVVSRVVQHTLLILSLWGLSAAALAQPISLTAGNYTQNFIHLSNAPGTTTNSELPPGWLLHEAGGAARDNELYAVDTGGTGVGDTYSYGKVGSGDRALGSVRTSTLVASYGACFANSTGAPLQQFYVAYTGEQWRLGTEGRPDQLDFQYSLDATSLTTGTWVDVNNLDFVTPNTTGAGAKDGNAAGNRRTRAAGISGVEIANGATFCVRWNDADANGADDGLAIDDFSLSVGTPGMPVVAISDANILEGNTGSTEVLLTLGLSTPAGPGSVTVEYVTVDGTATEGSDYVAQSGIAFISQGASGIQVGVQIKGDTLPEIDETLFVLITGVTGAVVGDGQGRAIIRNDDGAPTPIAQIQGSGPVSPLNGTVVTTEGVVTAKKFNADNLLVNGYFLQSETGDGNPATSEGIFVYTLTAPPAAAAVGNRLRVTGTVADFRPTSTSNQPPMTVILSVTTVQLMATGVPLPSPVELTINEFGPAALPGTAEKLESMRVSVASSRVVAGSEGTITDSLATATTTGVFHVVMPGVARPFRETGIGVMEAFPIPATKNPPRFDTNQERLMVRSGDQVGASALAVDADAQVTQLVGVLDYFEGAWALVPDALTPPTVTGGKAPQAVEDAGYEDVTVGAINLRRFFDEIEDGNGAPTLQPAALDLRLTKTSLALCDYLGSPDILGVVDAENLRVLALLADRINATCPAAPAYVPYLVQGNDGYGLNVGFLVSTRSVGIVDRVEVLEVAQFGKDTLFTNPDASTYLLNDRPPLMLRAVVHQDNGATFPVTVFVNHLRSLEDIDESASGSNGWATVSEQVRATRIEQARYLAHLVEARQQADPNERIILLGTFNAYEFSDGYADVVGIIRGEAAAEPSVLSFAESPVSVPLIDGSELIGDPAEKYSSVSAGSAQSLDHLVVNEALVMGAASLTLDHARINADFGAHHYGVAGNAIRVSDHDPVRLAIGVAEFRTADLAITASATPTTLAAGGTAEFRAIVDSVGPNSAVSPAVALVFDALFPVAISIPVSWTCTTPVQSDGKTRVTCTTATLVSGGQAVFDAFVDVPANAPTRTLHMGAAVASQSPDRSGADNRANASVNVLAVMPAADLGVRLIGGPTTSIPAGGIATMVAQVRNAGPNAAQPTVTFTGNVLPGRGSVVPPAGWSCVNTAPPGGSFSTACTAAGSLASGARANFTFYITAPNVPGQPTLEFLVSTSASTTSDPVPVNNSAGRTLQVTGAPVAIPVVSGAGG